NSNRDVGGFAALVTNNRQRPQAFAIYVHGRKDGILVHHLEIAVALIKLTDADFEILIQLLAIECLMHDGHIEEPYGNGDGPGIVHGPDDLAIGEGMISLEGDHSDLYLGALINGENQLDRVGGRYLFVGRLYH